MDTLVISDPTRVSDFIVLSDMSILLSTITPVSGGPATRPFACIEYGQSINQANAITNVLRFGHKKFNFRFQNIVTNRISCSPSSILYIHVNSDSL